MCEANYSKPEEKKEQWAYENRKDKTEFWKWGHKIFLSQDYVYHLDTYLEF